MHKLSGSVNVEKFGCFVRKSDPVIIDMTLFKTTQEVKSSE